MYRPVAPKKEMTRSGITELFVVRAAPAERDELRRTLDRMTAEQLQTAYEALQRQVELEATEERFYKALAESAAEDLRHHLRMQEVREPQRLAEEKFQLEQDRRTFADAARTLRSFGMTIANFNLIRQTVGENFSVYQVQEMIAANGATLSPPTQQELDEWTRQDIEAHNRRLLSADIPTLRKLAREAGARGPVAPQLDETQKVRQAERVDGTVYPSLPDEFRNGNNPEEVLDAAFIRKCSKETLRLLLKRYGADQVNEALRTRVGGIYQY